MTKYTSYQWPLRFLKWIEVPDWLPEWESKPINYVTIFCEACTRKHGMKVLYVLRACSDESHQGLLKFLKDHNPHDCPEMFHAKHVVHGAL